MNNNESAANKHWSIATALEQIDKCDFECEGGPLTNNVAYRWLKDAAKIGPEFWPGQGVWKQVSANVGGVKLTAWHHYYIIGCSMNSDTEGRYWTYVLSNDPPQPWHYGNISFAGIRGDELRLQKPEMAP